MLGSFLDFTCMILIIKYQKFVAFSFFLFVFVFYHLLVIHIGWVSISDIYCADNVGQRGRHGLV